MDFESQQQQWVNPPTDTRTYQAERRVPFPTPAKKIFDGLSESKSENKSKSKGVHSKYKTKKKKRTNRTVKMKK
eukprot:SAG22_NODE_1272_length_4923_cov_3.681385_4_plen_74_part_00